MHDGSCTPSRLTERRAKRKQDIGSASHSEAYYECNATITCPQAHRQTAPTEEKVKCEAINSQQRSLVQWLLVIFLHLNTSKAYQESFKKRHLNGRMNKKRKEESGSFVTWPPVCSALSLAEKYEWLPEKRRKQQAHTHTRVNRSKNKWGRLEIKWWEGTIWLWISSADSLSDKW